ncbi:hypothetical protein PGT21_035348 [Puccinia graminis f. sp. tritici]|nr:hypothetical protein PGT21_035348 [Puccinia graminis f. sp. tritici]
MKSFYCTFNVLFFMIATLHVNQVLSTRQNEPKEVREPQAQSGPIRDVDLYPPRVPTAPGDIDLYPPRVPTVSRDEDLYPPPNKEHEIQPGCCRFHCL